MSWRKWLVRGVVFTVAGGAALAGVAYRHWTNPEAVRAQVVAKLSQHLPGAIASVDSAELRLLGGISVGELRLVRRDDPQAAEFAVFPSGVIYHDKEALVRGKLAIRKIEFSHPRLRIVRRKDGSWNVTNILGPVNPEVPIPTIELQQATITVEDQKDGPGQPPVEIKDVNLTIVNDPHDPPRITALTFKGSGMADVIGPVELTGTLNRVTGDFTLSLDLPRVPVEGALVQRLAGYYPEAAGHLRQLSGIGGLHADLRYDPNGSVKWTHDIRVQLTRGSFAHAQLPLPLEAIDARARCIDGQVTLQELRARSGTAFLRVADVKLGALRADADLEGALDVQRLTLTGDLLTKLGDGLRDIQHDFDPEGSVSLWVKFRRREGKWWTHCVVRPDDLSILCARFPYRLEKVTGTIEHESGADHQKDNLALNLVGYAGTRPVYIAGKVEGARPAAVGVTIQATNVPIDERLTKALPPKFQHQVGTFSPSGLVDVAVHLVRKQGAPHFENQYVIKIHDASIRYEVFPYPVEKVSGTLEILPDHWEFREFRGSHKGGEFGGQGGSVPTPQGDRVVIDIEGSGALLDDEMRDSLRQPALQRAWKTLSPSGRLGFKAHVDHQPGAAEPHIAVTLLPSGCSVRPSFFKYDLDDVRGTIQYDQRKVTLNEVTARHGPSQLRVREGKITLDPDGGVAADLLDLLANPILADAELCSALPPALGKALAAVQLKEPVSFLANRLTFAINPDAAQPPYAFWEAGVRLDNATLQLGIAFRDVSGVVYCTGAHQGVFGDVKGHIKLDRATVLGQPFRDVHSQIVIQGSRPTLLQLPNLQAHLFDGDVGGMAWFDLGPTLTYQMYLKGSEMKLEEFGRSNQLGPKAQIRGLAAATLLLQGKGGELAGLEGRGEVDVPNGKMLNLPLLIDLLKVLNLHAPDGTAFEEAHAQFTIHGRRVDLSQVDFFGNAVSLSGRGSMNLDGTDLNLDFYAVYARIKQWLIFPFDKITEEMSKSLLRIKLRGQFGDVKTTKEPVPILVEPVKMLLRRMGGKAT